MSKLLPLLLIYPFLVAFNFCDKAQINSIYFEKENSFEEKNLCDSLENEKLERIQEILTIHQKISETLELPLNKIFSDKINITLRETLTGAFSSYASRNNISVGVYPGLDFKFDKSIYIHELAHIIARNENLQKINKSILFTEMFADFFALVVSENVIEPSVEKSCFDRLRYISEGQSFNAFAGYFSQYFSMKRAQKCCESKFLNQENINEVKLCEEVLRVGEIELDTTTRFTPIDVDFDDIDSHQVGIPLLSFFKRFTQKTDISMKEIFLKLFHFNFKERLTYECELEGKKSTFYPVLVKDFFDSLRSDLTLSQKKIFDELVLEKYLQKGFLLETEFYKNLYQEQTKRENFMLDFSTLRCEFI